MTSAQIRLGGRYRALVSGVVVTVRVTGLSPYGGWVALNETTGRTLRVRSAQRFRTEVTA